MNTTYKKRYPSPYQPKTYRASTPPIKSFDPRDKKHPIREEIEKLVGTLNFTAVIEEDSQTIAAMKVDGLVAFLCTLSKDGRVISQGRGCAQPNPMTRYMSRAVHFAFNSAISDAVMRATRVLDTLRADPNARTDSAIPAEPYTTDEPATEKQRRYLQELIALNVADEDERERQQLQLSELTKSEASRMIEQYRR